MSRSTAAPAGRLLTVAQAAEHLGTTTSALYELIARRAILSIRIADHQHTSHLATGDDLEDRNPRNRSVGQRRSGSSGRPPTFDAVPLPEHSRSGQDLSERRQPNSRATAKSDTCMQLRL